MKKEVIVCDFCQTNQVADKCCCICGKDYCIKHACRISVLVGGENQLAVRDNLEVCPNCHDLLTFDNWTTGEEFTRTPEFDRPIIKMILPNAIEAVKQSLREIRHSIGPGNIRDWISRNQKPNLVKHLKNNLRM